MRRLLATSVVLLVLLAGCSTASIPQSRTPHPATQDLSFTVSNEADERYEVRLSVMPPAVSGIEVVYVNGSTGRFDVTSFEGVPRGALRNATAVSAVGTDAPSESFSVGPDRGVGTTIADVPADATVVYLVLSPDGQPLTRSAGVVRCGGPGQTDLSVRIRPDGSLHSAVVCGSGDER